MLRSQVVQPTLERVQGSIPDRARAREPWRAPILAQLDDLAHGDGNDHRCSRAGPHRRSGDVGGHSRIADADAAGADVGGTDDRFSRVLLPDPFAQQRDEVAGFAIAVASRRAMKSPYPAVRPGCATACACLLGREAQVLVLGAATLIGSGLEGGGHELPLWTMAPSRVGRHCRDRRWRRHRACRHTP